MGVGECHPGIRVMPVHVLHCLTDKYNGDCVRDRWWLLVFMNILQRTSGRRQRILMMPPDVLNCTPVCPVDLSKIMSRSKLNGIEKSESDDNHW